MTEYVGFHGMLTRHSLQHSVVDIGEIILKKSRPEVILIQTRTERPYGFWFSLRSLESGANGREKSF